MQYEWMNQINLVLIANKELHSNLYVNDLGDLDIRSPWFTSLAHGTHVDILSSIPLQVVVTF